MRCDIATFSSVSAGHAMLIGWCRAPQQAEDGEVTLFDKIVKKQIPATILYEDDTALAFK